MSAWLLVAAVAALALRTSYAAAAWFTHTGGIQRFHVETSAAWLVALGVLLAFVQRAPSGSDDLAAEEADIRTWVLWCAAAVVVFLPALSVGFLSDDFVLVERARHAQFGLFDPAAFRPVPLAAWSALLALGAGAPVLHLLNVVLHGVNAFLTYRLAAAFVPRRWAIAAGVLMLTFPLAPEAVVWCSGVFDVTATTFVLLTVLVARGYTADAPPSRRIAFLSTAVLGILCKETALVTAVVVVLDAVARRAMPRRLLRDTSVLLAASVTLAVARLVMAPEIARQPLTRYTLQRWLFGTVASLAAPVHVETVRAAAWLPIAEALLLIALFTAYVLIRHSTRTLRPAVAYALFALIATLPAVTFFSVGPDLQQSRYLYLSSAGYACCLVFMARALAERRSPAWTSAAIALVALLGVIHIANLESNERRWVQAAVLRDRIMGAVAIDAEARHCASMSILGLPDNDKGAYVFRNGAAEAFRTIGVTVSDASAGPCLFRWTQVR